LFISDNCNVNSDSYANIGDNKESEVNIIGGGKDHSFRVIDYEVFLTK